MGEVYLPAARTGPYLEHLDAVFAFELFHAPWEEEALRSAIEGSRGAAWVLSNHDFSRTANRFGPENVRAAAVLLLTLPGLVFLYQGEEIGQVDGPAGETAYDRAGRDPFRHPVQWEPEPERAGFTTGTPWLAPVDAGERSVAAQSGAPGSLLELYRALIALRPALGPGLDAARRRPRGPLVRAREPRRGREHHRRGPARARRRDGARERAGRGARGHDRPPRRGSFSCRLNRWLQAPAAG